MFVKVIKTVTSVCHIDRYKYSDGSRPVYNTVYSGTCSLRLWRTILSVYCKLESEAGDNSNPKV